MALQLRLPFNHLSLPPPNRKPLSTTTRAAVIRCGPRGNRGPLVKGRVLSIEAIQAVQALKRGAQRLTLTLTLEDDAYLSKTLSRLIKSDLIATLRELLRQQHCDLALKVFSTVRSEPWYKTDLGLYADLVLGLAKKGLGEDIDRLIEELEMDGGMIDWEDKKGLSRLIRALIGADRRESTVRIYGVMKRSGWGSTQSGVEVDEYVAKVLSKGLRRFGEKDLAMEVDLALERYNKACLQRFSV